jgi:VWFA-related protein
MTRRTCLAAITLMLAIACALSGAVAASPQDPGGQTPTFRATTDMVRVDVRVRQNGRAVAGLTADQFEILDKGVPQRVLDLSFERLPIDVTVALDLSASVRGDTLATLRDAIDRLEDQLRPSDRLTLVNFNMRVRRVADSRDPRMRASEAVVSGAVGGATSLLDTVVTLLAAPAPVDRRQLIIVFSDGVDTLSISEPETVLAVAARTTATLAFVPPLTTVRTGSSFGSAASGQPSLVSPFSSGVRTVGSGLDEIYQQLATETGGVVVRTGGSDVRFTFSRLLEDFRSSYVLYYAPTGVERPGFHPVEVRVRRSGTYEVRARPGYLVDEP